MSPTANAQASGTPLVELRGVTKAFPGVVALDRVDLTLHPSEVRALTGENGSGKSTLARVLNGSMQPDAGQLFIDGRETTVADPKTALELGIVTISQELTLAPSLTVAENVFMGRLPLRRGRVDWSRLAADTAAVLERLRVEISPTAVVAQLGIERQQEVEIARALAIEARLLILDEATSSLSESARDRLLELVEEQRAAGVCVLMISHRMPEVYAAAGSATVLRDGRLVGTVGLHETSERALVEMMVGRELTDYFGKRSIAAGEEILRIEGLATEDGALQPTSVSVRRGEILGVAGLAGSGMAEFGRALGGSIPCHGSVHVGSDRVPLDRPKSILAGGIGYVPDDRKRAAILPMRSVAENFSLVWQDEISKLGVLDVRKEGRMVRESIARYGVTAASPRVPISTLSGGNQQKVVLGRILSLGTEVLVLAEPTRGIDVGAKSEIYTLIQDAAAAGAAIVLVSSELPELLGIADRIVVFFRGRIRASFARAEMDERAIAHVAVTGEPLDGASNQEGVI